MNAKSQIGELKEIAKLKDANSKLSKSNTYLLDKGSIYEEEKQALNNEISRLKKKVKA